MVSAKRKAAAAAVAAGAVARPRGKAPNGFPDWDGQQGVWTNSDGGTRAPGGQAAARAEASSSATTQPAAQQPTSWEEERAGFLCRLAQQRAKAARTPVGPIAGPIAHEEIMPPCADDLGGVNLPIFESDYNSRVSDRFRKYGSLGSMLGPPQFNRWEWVASLAAGRQRRWSF